MNRNQPAPTNMRAYYQTKFTQSRYNLLLVIGMTGLNIAIVLFGSLRYFLFSATIPYTLVFDGVYLTGRLPEEYYTDWPANVAFWETSYLTTMIVIAAAIILVYLGCFFFSKKFKTGWMLVAAVLFVIDTLYMLLIVGIGLDSVMDILIHAWVLYYLISGVVYGFKLKKLPEEDPAEQGAIPEVPYVDLTAVNNDVSSEKKAEEKTESADEEDK